jgi:hypothetical protein
LLSQFRIPGKVPVKQDPEEGGSKLTVDETGRLIAEVFQTSITKDGPNYTFRLVWPDEAEHGPDPKRIGRVFIERLIEYFETHFGRKLSRGEAGEMLDFLSEK